MPLVNVNKEINKFGKGLDKVMRELEKNLLDVLGAAAEGDTFSATVLLNSQPAMIEALRDAGYFELAEEHVQFFQSIPQDTIDAFERLGLPKPEYTTLDAEDFRALAQMDLDQFNNIGVRAMNELRLGMVRDSVAGQPFSRFVEAVRDATVGTAANGSPLRNYAYTHANTAALNFSGEAVIKAGESLGFDTPDSLWRVSGVFDSKTRDVCVDALNDPVRTRAEWEAAGYWGGEPGGYNCRHQLVPYFGE